MTDYSFQTLHSDGGARVIFRGVVGSRAYGTDRPESDEDIRGVFLVPPLEYALLAAPPEQVADERNDRVYYSLRRSALSVRWIVALASMPPVPFPELFAASDLDPAVRASIDDIIAAKRDASERHRTTLPSILSALFAENEAIVPVAASLKKGNSNVEILDELLQLILSRYDQIGKID